ncbi:MAG: N-acetyltransferase [Flavobacteriaceae bacterium]|jgi:predicted GNAT family acetyltransferase|nr:N-acetyltransferase [Flavobacteriaceae bacterium]MBT5596113.1 N-acetyltransferase [Flavobacteriaceae bacterium]MBT6688410.1 N-acetyltransferase [Flavobacteriaceae bacterium]|tara:strand:+ start:1325 stop:1618 length:294 start_codon:yes stop_codon:yes gene_type:complete
MGNLIIYDNTFLRQYEVEIGEDLAKIEYALQDRKIFLTKLVIPSSNKDEDFEETFIKEVFEIIKEKNIRIMPTSPQIRKFIKKHKEFKELLPIGIRL